MEQMQLFAGLNIYSETETTTRTIKDEKGNFPITAELMKVPSEASLKECMIGALLQTMTNDLEMLKKFKTTVNGI